MRKKTTLIGTVVALCLAATLAFTVTAARKPAAAMASGKVALMSAGPLAFGPNGILFVGDSMGAQIVAIDTGDTKAMSTAKINVQGVDVQIAGLAGVTPDQIVINSVKVNPISKNVYLSASRGKGPDAMPLIAKIDATGKVTLVSLDNVKYASVSLVDAPEAPAPGAVGANGRPVQNPRVSTITDMNYVNGNLMVAGLSNEEWNSALRSIPFSNGSFQTADKGATLQIWHSSHGRYETQAPIRTFVPYTIAGQQYVLAAYTCTPLVKIPVSDLKPGAQVKGVEIADLGSGNNPLDMVPYKQNGHDFILIANTSYGVVKLKADSLETYPAIAEPTRTDVAGVPYDKITSLSNVQHLAQIDGTNVLVETATPGSGPAFNPGPAVGPVNLTTIALP
jgi:hypothetical protein